MLPRLFAVRKPDRFCGALGSPKWQFSSAIGNLRITSSFTTCALFGVTVFSLSTLYALQSRFSKVSAAAASPPIVNEGKHSKIECPPWDFNWDGRINSPSTAVRSYTLVRHGQYVSAMLDRGRVLTELGRQQAHVTGKRLKESSVEYDLILCSTLTRAKQTAEIITKELFPETSKQPIEIHYDPNLNEGAPSYIIPERQSINESSFWDDIESDSERISQAFRTHIHRNESDKDENVLIIGHGNVFRYFVCRVLQIPPHAWLRFAICNASITRFNVYGDGRVSVQCLGSDGHFDKDLITFN